VLLNWAKESENSQGDSRVRGGFKVIPRISKLQGYNTLEETLLMKSNHGYKINTPIMLLKHHDMWPSLNPPRKLQNENFGTDTESDLAASSSL
jgi:hypothetical protein